MAAAHRIKQLAGDGHDLGTDAISGEQGDPVAGHRGSLGHKMGRPGG
jgi:hypothetical protein